MRFVFVRTHVIAHNPSSSPFGERLLLTVASSLHPAAQLMKGGGGLAIRSTTCHDAADDPGFVRKLLKVFFGYRG
jgi:hypothetical protein